MIDSKNEEVLLLSIGEMLIVQSSINVKFHNLLVIQSIAEFFDSVRGYNGSRRLRCVMNTSDTRTEEEESK